MEEFLFIFRTDYNAIPKDSPAEMRAMRKKWQDWMGSIAAQDKLSETGKRMEPTGKVVKPDDVVTDGPYVEMKETVAGYMFVKAADIDEATGLTKGCPALDVGGSVEVRPIMGVSSND